MTGRGGGKRLERWRERHGIEYTPTEGEVET